MRRILVTMLMAVGLFIPAFVGTQVTETPEAGATITQSFRQEYRSDIFCYDIQQNYHGDSNTMELDIYVFYFNINTGSCYAYAYHAVHAYSTGSFCWYLDNRFPYQFGHVNLVSNSYENNNFSGCQAPVWRTYGSPYTDFNGGGFFHHSPGGWIYEGGGAAWNTDIEYVVRDGSNSLSPVVDWERGFRLD